MAEFRCPVCGGPYPWRVWRSKNGLWCRHGERSTFWTDHEKRLADPEYAAAFARDEMLPQPDGPSMDLLVAETDSILGHAGWFARLRARIFGRSKSVEFGRTGEDQ